MLVSFNHFFFLLIKTCDIRAEGTKRFLTLKGVQLDQSGEVSYQALNAITSAMLTVKGELVKTPMSRCILKCFPCVLTCHSARYFL